VVEREGKDRHKCLVGEEEVSLILGGGGGSRLDWGGGLGTSKTECKRRGVVGKKKAGVDIRNTDRGVFREESAGQGICEDVSGRWCVGRGSGEGHKFFLGMAGRGELVGEMGAAAGR